MYLDKTSVYVTSLGDIGNYNLNKMQFLHDIQKNIKYTSMYS